MVYISLEKCCCCNNWTLITANYDAILYDILKPSVWDFETICVLESLAKESPNFIYGGSLGWP